jgi:glutathione S-transferase
MSKSIVFCADGTWNGPDDATGASVIDSADVHGELLTSSVTNVVKLYASLAGQVTPDTVRLNDEQEKVLVDAAGNTLQAAKYIHGVGDAENIAVKLLGGIFGAGVIARIVRGYTFISRNYRAGDLIYIAGFSRGAYTARALAGMIARVGLIDPAVHDLNDKATAYRIGTSAWYKSHGIAINAIPATGIGDLLGHLVDYIEDWVGSSLSPNSLIANVPIRAVAVWDTVGSLGIPEYVKDQRIDLFRFVDLNLSPSVEFGFHAMSIDEMRADFPVTRWIARQNVVQQWFAGAHADVGGGYPRDGSGLSDITLAWLSQKLASTGAQFAAPPVYVPALDKFTQEIHMPWMRPPFDCLLQSPRHVEPADTVDATVQYRLIADQGYRPAALADWLRANPLQN